MNQNAPNDLDLFNAALELGTWHERHAFLDQACGSDTALREKVDSLLTSYEHGADSLDRFGGTISSQLPALEKPGDLIGRYKLLEQIGEGGCGVVYLAEQQQPVRRRVALKVIKAGMDTRQVIARFEAERQALALMDHPNIARVYDAGATEKGRPYFVMEYVDGLKITDYCAQNQLSLRDRVHLFLQICEAVQHAHQKGIIHRDLKPTNILVCQKNAAPTAQVIDFGVAKAIDQRLTEHTLVTHVTQLIGTPAYMSPEQADLAQGATDTRTDIYSLGAVLYELVTGRPPFDNQQLLALGLEEMRRTIREVEPKRPSQSLVGADVRRLNSHYEIKNLKSEITSDLDCIILKALEKDPARRYQTPQSLADDLQRYLNNEPITARPITRPARLIRWSQRNPALATAYSLALLLVLLLLLGSPLAIYRINQARKAEADARSSAENATQNELALRNKAEAEAYTADMNVAMQAWEQGNLSRARARLRAYIPLPGRTDLRGFEWRYLWNLCRDESRLTLISTNNPVWRFSSSQAHSFVAACAETAVLLLDPESGRQLFRLPFPDIISQNKWSLIDVAPGATNLLATHRADGIVLLWDLSTRSLLTTLHATSNRLCALALSPDGKLLATGEFAHPSRHLSVWDISGRTNAALAWSCELAMSPNVVKFSPNGETIIAASKPFDEGTLQAWDAKTGRDLPPFPKRSVGYIFDIAFSPDGRLLAASGIQSRINVWNLQERSLEFFLDGHQGLVRWLSFSSDGRQLISGGADSSIRFWDIHARQSLGMLRHPGEREIIACYSPDGNSVFSASGEEMKIWPGAPQEQAQTFNSGDEWAAGDFSPDNRWFVTGGYAVTPKARTSVLAVRDASTFSKLFFLSLTNRQVIAGSFSKDGKYFASGGEDRVVAVWDTSLWPRDPSDEKDILFEPSLYLPNEFESCDGHFSPDGKILVVAGRSFAPEQPSHAVRRLAFWETGTWRKLDLLPEAGRAATEAEAAGTAQFSFDNRLLAVGYANGFARVWDRHTGAKVEEIRLPLGEEAGVHFAQNSLWLGIQAQNDPTVLVVNLAEPAPRQIHALTARPGAWMVDFDLEGKTAITHGDDGHIKFWSLNTFKLALVLRHGYGPGGSLNVSPDGNSLYSSDAHGVFKLWSAFPLSRLKTPE